MWPKVIAACVFVTLVCNAVDRFYTRHEKTRVHDAVIRLWCWLDELHVPAIHTAIAKSTMATIRRCLRGWPQVVLAIIGIVLASLLFTICAIEFGTRLDHIMDENFPVIFEIRRDIAFALIGINLMFHVVTILAAVAALRVLAQATSLWSSLKIIFFWIFGMFLIGEKAFGVLACASNGYHRAYFYTALDRAFQDGYWTYTLYSLNLIIPFCIYAGVVLLCVLATAFLRATLLIARRLAYVEADKKLPHEVAPWTMIGLLISLISGVVALVVTLSK